MQITNPEAFTDYHSSYCPFRLISSWYVIEISDTDLIKKHHKNGNVATAQGGPTYGVNEYHDDIIFVGMI